MAALQEFISLRARSCYEHNLDKLRYSGPADLIEATRSSLYVPERLSAKPIGEYLVIR